jgi:hydroxypyruvate reductase
MRDAERDLRAAAVALQRAALAAVDPAAAVHRHARREADTFFVAGRRYDLRGYERIFLLAFGKAAVPMAAAVVEIVGDRLSSGVVITKYGHAQSRTPNPDAPESTRRLPLNSSPDEQESQRLGPGLHIIEAGHPVPDQNSLRGAQAIANLAEQATERDLVICLISGGGSALLALPAPGLTLTDLQTLTDALLRSGAKIHELNTVRKHCSLLKGGDLARLVAPATLVTLVLSDVVGDPLDVIASGPTVPDRTAVADAHAVLERYGIRLGRPIPFRETPKPGDPVFARAQHVVVASNRLAALAATEQARRLGFSALLLSTYVEGEAREVANVAAALAKGARTHGDPLPSPACLVWGGETTVTVRGMGRGGRNQELALAAALALEGWPGVLVMALATDGTDGPTDAAGAIVTGETVARARALGLDPRAALAANDAYPFFDALGDLVRTGPTGTNVNDLLFVLVEKSPAGSQSAGG